MSILLLWSKTFYTTIGQYPTLYNFLAITQEDLIRWEYHLDNPNMSVNPKNFQSTLILPPMHSGEVSHHMRDSGESNDLSICHTTNKTCLSICQSCQPSVSHTVTMTSLSVCQTYILPVSHTIMVTSPSIHQSYLMSDHHTNLTTSLSICQSHQSSVSHTINMNSPSVCQPHDTSVCHTINMTRPSIGHQQYMSICHTVNTNSPSICQPHDMSICHTNITSSLSLCMTYQLSNHHTTTMACLSVCQSNQLSDHHTTTKTSPSICQSHIPSVCHNVIPTSPSICQLQDLSVCYPTHDVIRTTIWPTVCSSSVTSVLPSANPTVKIAMSIPVPKFLHALMLGKIPFIHTPMDSSVHHSHSLSVNLSPSAANPSKIPCNYGEKDAVNYLHEIPVKSASVSTSYIMPFIAPVHASSIQSIHILCVMSVVAPICASSVQPVCTSCIMSVIAPVCALPILSIHPSNDEHQEFPDGFPGTKYGEKNPSEIMVKFPHDITLTLHQAKFPQETPDTIKGVIYPGNLLSTQIWVKFTVINLRNYMLGVFQVTLCTMRCAHGSINDILMDWDPGPTYVVQRLWDPGGPTYSSRSSAPTDQDKLDKPKSYLDYIHLPGLSSLPFLVTVKPNLAPSNHLGQLDHMGSFRYYLD